MIFGFANVNCVCLDLFSILSFALFCWKSRSLIPQKEKPQKRKEKNTALNDSAALHQSKISIWYFKQSEDSIFKIGIESLKSLCFRFLQSQLTTHKTLNTVFYFFKFKCFLLLSNLNTAPIWFGSQLLIIKNYANKLFSFSLVLYVI